MALHPADAVLTPVGPGRELDWKLVARRCQRNGGAAALIVPPKIYLPAGSRLSTATNPEHSKPQVGLPRFDGQGWWLGQATCLTTSSSVAVSNSWGVL